MTVTQSLDWEQHLEDTYGFSLSESLEASEDLWGPRLPRDLPRALDYASHAREMIHEKVPFEVALDYYDHHAGHDHHWRRQHPGVRSPRQKLVDWFNLYMLDSGENCHDYYGLSYKLGGQIGTWTDRNGNHRLVSADEQKVSGLTDLDGLANMVGCLHGEIDRGTTDTVCYSRVWNCWLSHTTTVVGPVTYAIHNPGEGPLLTGVINTEIGGFDRLWPVLQDAVCVLTGRKL